MSRAPRGNPGPSSPKACSKGSFVSRVAGADQYGTCFSPCECSVPQRWRDLLPLPHVKVEQSCVRSQVSTSKLRRCKRRIKNANLVNGIIDSLNEMSGFQSASLQKPTKAQQLAHHKLFSAVSHAPRCDTVAQPREAVFELLRTGLSGYDCVDEARSTVRAYSQGLVSLPGSGAEVFGAEALLDDIGRDILRDPQAHLFHSEVQPNSRIKPYMAEVLRQSSTAYHDFIFDLYDKGMVTFGKEHRSTITPFFVIKKNGKFRLVLDCRQTNQMFKPPPDIAMSAGYTFGQLAMEEDQTLSVAQSDIRDYFYSIGLPEYLLPYFCLPAIRPNLLRDRCAELSGVGDEEKIYPQMRVIPMGWNWAMYFAQRIHQHQVMLATGVPHEQVLADGRPAPNLSSGKTLIVPYADNQSEHHWSKQTRSATAKGSGRCSSSTGWLQNPRGRRRSYSGTSIGIHHRWHSRKSASHSREAGQSHCCTEVVGHTSKSGREVLGEDYWTLHSFFHASARVPQHFPFRLRL